MNIRIATIHFAPVHCDRNPVGLGHFNLPAVENGAEPFILDLGEYRIQRERGPYGDSLNQTQRPIITHQVRSLEIALDIVAEWTERGHMMDTEAHPGIWLVRDYVPDLDGTGAVKLDADNRTIWVEASPAEKKRMWEEDHAAAKAAGRLYAMRLFDYWSSRVREKPEMRQFISRVCRLGAAHYGFKANWLNEAITTQTELCPYCAQAVPSEAVLCPNCHQVVNIEAYASLEAKKARALESAMGSKPIAPPIAKPAQQARQ